ncbi:3-dehydroquinate synthase [Microaerobacter geothermalis]|uniref:3-dehydroquinate synthase n=1 Tax=Microaerobacter geothermalis TaxID=674972 RepID=UPI001F204E2C|nr:3-dehydroquinate synthase [Microaerobacter geothermalis]MCF6093381.1 3-dehydroquinate synthase [Microaerobacter geothermalis]
MVTLKVELGDRSYPIHIGSHLLERLHSLLSPFISKGKKVLIITDRHVAPLYLQTVEEQIRRTGADVFSYQVNPGESAKSLSVFQEIIGFALQNGLDRKSVVLALGGGVVGDLAGFVAATYMRGIPFVQIPTTLLAHDSSVGGKVAVNHPLGKNIIGSFHQPLMVVYDTNTLKTLPSRELSAGFSEVIKHGFIWDAQFVQWLDQNAQSLWNLEEPMLSEAIYRGCLVKVHVVSNDEKEEGLRAILNLGHTIGHAIETLSGYGELNHGEAVAIGMVGAAKLAEKLGIVEEIFSLSEEYTRILKKYHLPTSLPGHFSPDEVISVMKRDKKNRENTIVMVLPKKFGEVIITKGVPEAAIKEVLTELKQK